LDYKGKRNPVAVRLGDKDKRQPLQWLAKVAAGLGGAARHGWLAGGRPHNTRRAC